MNESVRGKGRSRLLSPEEVELWTRVTADVRPAPGRAARRAPEPASRGAETKTAPAPAAAVEKKAPPVRPPPPVSDIDHRTRTKLRRGRLEVDAKLDLHGLRQAEAQRALNDFLRRAQAGGAKMAIVVTGKGARSEEGGVLRRLVPLWLQAAHLRDVVVSYGEAARNHGGEGALYVQIRRAARSRG